jgi:hypothetical protein
MREPMGGKPTGEIKVKVVSDGRDTILEILGAVSSRPDRTSVGRRQSAYVGTRKMVNYA